MAADANAVRRGRRLAPSGLYVQGRVAHNGRIGVEGPRNYKAKDNRAMSTMTMSVLRSPRRLYGIEDKI